jgi:hypothetical protein
MQEQSGFSRRDFLKVTGLFLGALAMPPGLKSPSHSLKSAHLLYDWPRIRVDDLPDQVAEILWRTPNLAINAQGILGLMDPLDQVMVPVPLAPTQWNLDHSKHYERLAANFPWAIVLHWFGDPPGRNRTLKNYLNGFNSLRRDEEIDFEFTTSAHFLVGEHDLMSASTGDQVAIVQTQAPYSDGIPLVAAHLRGLSMEKYEENKQYFVKAFNHFSLHDPEAHSLLQDIYEGRWIHPNSRSLGIEVTGSHFDTRPPGAQQAANVLGLLKAIMLRYKIPAENILGHHEIQMNKADPGKQFMAWMRFLVGVKALVDGDPEFRRLVFGRFLNSRGDALRAIRKYFHFVRDYHKMISKPIQVYEWEILSKYWGVMRTIDRDNNPLMQASLMFPPIAGEVAISGWQYLIPENHEGVDIHYNETVRQSLRTMTTPVSLIAGGQCLYAGEIKRKHYGRQVIFRHIQQDGGEVMSVYSHLTGVNQLEVGKIYPIRYLVGSVENQRKLHNPYLHFAIAYGSTWSNDLAGKGEVPYGAGPSYIRARYLDPVHYLESLANSLEIAKRRIDT